MPRQRGGAAPVRPRPTVPAAKPVPAPARQHSTAATPAPASAAAPPAAAAPQGPGLFGQMASTAAGVAVGSSIGHAVGGWFSGGSSAAAPADAAPTSSEFQAQHQVNTSSQAAQTGPCADNVTSFRRCMDENQGSLTICGWYLDQLKACQAAAGQY